MIEADVENYLVKEVKKRGGHIRKCEWVGRRGAPDRFVMLNGGHWVELKRPGRKVDPHQVREHVRFGEHSIVVHIIDTKEKVDNFLKDIVDA